MSPPRTPAAEFLKRHGLELAALALFLLCLGRIWAARTWMLDLKPFLLALLGLVAFIASDEVAMATGGYGWTRDTWRELPVEAVKWGGAALLVYSAFGILSA